MDRKAQPFPYFEETLPFSSLLYQIELHIARAIDSPYTFDQLRGPPFSSHLIRPLAKSLDQSRHPAIIAALLAARLDFSVQEDERAIHEARAFTAELVALRFAAHLPEAELVKYVTYEIPRKPAAPGISHSSSSTSVIQSTPTDERTGLLSENSTDQDDSFNVDIERNAGSDGAPYVSESAIGLSALELAILGDAKKFLLSRAIEQIITKIWEGQIVFWDSISIQSMKKPSFYNPNRPGNDIYSRLRVPKYRMFFMMLNYVSLLALYYAVLVDRNYNRITFLEVALDIWYAGFVYEEIGQVRESGSIRYYASDYWSFFDMAMIFIFLAFFVTRLMSVVPGFDERYANAAFDILSLEALLLVPRVFSSLSISPYFGTLLPCLKQMTKDFMKFLVIIVILYFGFLTTFSFLGRDHFAVNQMAWLLIRVFFGAPYDGLDAASEISPVFGPTLMLIFVILTNVLLITVVISILSQRFGRMMNNANEEYMLLFASSVMESITTSDRVTYFYPPLNLIGILIRPLRLFMNHNEHRHMRIFILKITHAPLIGLLWIYETLKYRISTNMREKNSALLHLNTRKKKWGPKYAAVAATRNVHQGTVSTIPKGLFLANQVILSGTNPELARTIFDNEEIDSKNNDNGNSSHGFGTGTEPKSGDVVTRRKTRKSAIVSKKQTSNTTSPPNRPPLAAWGSQGSDKSHLEPSNEVTDFARSVQDSTGKRYKGRRSDTSNAGSGTTSSKHVRRSRLAISLLRDLRRRSVTLPIQNTSAFNDSNVGSSTTDFGLTDPNNDSHAKFLASSVGGDFDDSNEQEEFSLGSMHDGTGGGARNKLRRRGTLADELDSVIEEDEDDEDDEDEENESEDEEDEEDEDDEFLNLYADHTSVRIAKLEEQVYRMRELLENTNALLIETMQQKM
ncbi:hypothetical protein V1511DRAFT_460364 [Dipodascopsis uninucleata]